MIKLSLLSFILIAVILPNPAFAQSNASIKFVKPIDRHNVELGQITVEVAISGVVSGDGSSWRVWVDGEPSAMVRDTTTTQVVVKQPSGPHRLKAELYDASGAAIASNDILVMAATVEDHTPIFNQAWFGPAMAVLSLFVIIILIVGLRLRPRTTTW